MKADTAIIIVTYNSEGHIAACLESVFAKTVRVSKQVIVVDNDSRDGTVELIRRDFPDVELLLPGENLGFAKGVNLGAKHAKAEFVLLLNPDTELLENAVDGIVEFARANPSHGIYGGRTLKPDGTLEPSSCWGEPTLWSMALFAFGITTLAPRNRWLDPESLGSWQRDSALKVGIVTGCFLLARKEMWDGLGGMDESFFMYGEDADFSMRARRAGYAPIICPDARLVHEVGQCSQTPVHKTMLLYRGKAMLLRKHWKGSAMTFGLFLLTAGTGLRAAATLLLPKARGTDAAGRWQTLWKRRNEWLRGYEGTTEGVAAH